MRGIRAPQRFIIGFLITMLVAAFHLGIPLGAIVNDSLVRLVMNGVLVLSLMPMLNAGIGINYGLPVGICAGLLGLCLAVNFRLSGWPGFAGAMLFSLPGSVLFGFAYAKILNRVKGREEVAATFVGFSFLFAMNFFWAVAPFQNPAMLWPIGGEGMRPAIGLKGYLPVS
jgi:simple sugar transport system permease protein